MSLFGGFSEPKFKAQLKMAIQRIKLLNNKIENEVKRLKREIAGLLNKPDKEEEKAKIKCEHLIRGDHTIAAHCILELMLESLIARVKLIAHTKHCPEDLLQATSTLVYCSTRVDVPELKKIRQMLQAKYKKAWIKRAMDNLDSAVNRKVLQKLNLCNPKEDMVRNYLKSIAKEYGFEWEPQEEPDPMAMSAAPIGRDVNPAAATGFTHNYGPDGTPIIAGAYGGGPGGSVPSMPDMLPGPPQYAHMEQPNQDPQFGHQPQQAQYGQPQPQFNQQPNQYSQQYGQQYGQSQGGNPHMVGSFGVNPNTAPNMTDSTNQMGHSHNHTLCPTCGSSVDPNRLPHHMRPQQQQQQQQQQEQQQPPQYHQQPPAPNQFDSENSFSLPGPPPMDDNTSQALDADSSSDGHYTPQFGGGGSNSHHSMGAPLPPASFGSGGQTGNVETDDFGIPMAPSIVPGGAGTTGAVNGGFDDDDDLPPPPPADDGSMGPGGGDSNDAPPDMDELTARFNNLLQ